MEEDFPSVNDHLMGLPKPASSSQSDLDSSSQTGKQLSLRGLLFLIVESAIISTLVRMAFENNSAPTPVIASTLTSFTLLGCVIGIVIGFQRTAGWWYVGPLAGTLAGFLAASVTLTPANNAVRMLSVSLIASTMLIALICWLGRQMPQEEIGA